MTKGAVKLYTLAEVQIQFDKALQYGVVDSVQYWAGWRDALISLRIAGLLPPMTAEEARGLPAES